MTVTCRVCEAEVQGESDGRSPALLCEKCGAPLPTGASVLGKMAVKRVRPEDIPDGPVMMGAVVAAEAPAGGGAANGRPPSVMTGLVLPTKPRFGCTVVLEDSELQRTIVRDGLLQLGMAEQVVCASDGMEFLTTLTQAFITGAPVDLAILDLELPSLGGYHTALALRAVEKAYGRDPVPILFFSARVLDEAARRALAGVGSAHFLSKDTSRGANQFIERLVEALRLLGPHAAAS